MTIEIIETQTVELNGVPIARRAEIIITQNGTSYLHSVSGLPLTGDLQSVLDAREGELFAAAQAKGREVNLYEMMPRRVVRALALAVLDEINILRQRAGLPLRNAGQIDDAIKTKLKSL